jgi:hypothetical protein
MARELGLDRKTVKRIRIQERPAQPVRSNEWLGQWVVLQGVTLFRPHYALLRIFGEQCKGMALARHTDYCSNSSRRYDLAETSEMPIREEHMTIMISGEIRSIC